MASRNSVDGSGPAGTILLVVHDFIARSPDELSLAKGDRIELIERDDDFGDGWFLGRHMQNGNSGLFPEVYTTPAPRGTLNAGPNQRRTTSEPFGSKAHSEDRASEGRTNGQRFASMSATTQRPASAQSSASPLAHTALRSSLPPASSASSNPRSYSMMGGDSPVMNETLSVIDEHITDMSTPRTSISNGGKRDTMGSMYSTQLPRASYINGHETDEEEHDLHTEEDVMAWSPDRVAEYLEDHGVDREHCKTFQEQEISGEVLLAMEQSSVFIKEFDLGAVGRRLKTWHKIKALQDEVRQPPLSQRKRSVSDYTDDDASDTSRNRSASAATLLPRFTSRTTDREGRGNTMQASSSILQPSAPAPSNTVPSLSSATTAAAISPLQGMTSFPGKQENTTRPSAQSVRSMNHSRRHSSMDSNFIDANVASSPGRHSLRKQPSIDSAWQPGQQSNGKASSTSTRHSHTLISDASTGTFPNLEVSPSELDRGYFSQSEMDKRSSMPNRNVRKKAHYSAAAALVSPIQSRNSSFINSGRRSVQGSTPLGGTESMHDLVSPIVPSAASHYFGGAKFNSLGGSNRPTSSKPMTAAKDPISPVVTKLEYNDSTSMNSIAANPRPQTESDSSSVTNVTPSPASHHFSMFSSASKPKATGLRAISDAITRNEKTMATLPVDKPGAVKDAPIASSTRTGSTTPSTEAKSLDLPKSELQPRTSVGSAGGLMPPLASSRRPKTRTKKSTSAYTRGLEKKTPQQQMDGCDYSGWMKKKSSSLMTTWKPRLFILRGRRLSYYYADSDTEEKGLIDISFHRVLAAHDERLTGLHASLTGAASSRASPPATTPTHAARDLASRPPAQQGDDADGIFIFKLVPPKAGLSKAVSFTKPMVHYFAVDSRAAGRLWMAALMKATIDRDGAGVVTTTYSQKTISLAKARARSERPPALMEDSADGRAELDGGVEGMGLGIGGLGVEKAAVAGAEDEQEGGSVSVARGTAAPVEAVPVLG